MVPCSAPDIPRTGSNPFYLQAFDSRGVLGLSRVKEFHSRCLAAPDGNINVIMKADEKENCQFESKEWGERERERETDWRKREGERVIPPTTRPKSLQSVWGFLFLLFSMRLNTKKQNEEIMLKYNSTRWDSRSNDLINRPIVSCDGTHIPTELHTGVSMDIHHSSISWHFCAVHSPRRSQHFMKLCFSMFFSKHIMRKNLFFLLPGPDPPLTTPGQRGLNSGEGPLGSSQSEVSTFR